MEITYDITAEDYIAFNLYYMRTNPASRRNILKARIQGVVLILAGGGLCGYMSGKYTPLLIGIFALAAVLYAIFIPRTITKKVVNNVRKMLKQAGGVACGQKTLSLEEDRFRLKGAGEDSLYEYAAVQQVATDEAHYYIFTGVIEALIVPFTAFADEKAREAFMLDFNRRVTESGGASAK